MNTFCLNSPFSAEIGGEVLVIRQCYPGEGWRGYGLIDLRQQPLFRLAGASVLCINARGHETALTTDSAAQASLLLDVILSARLRHVRKRALARGLAVGTLLLAALWVAFSTSWQRPSVTLSPRPVEAVSAPPPRVDMPSRPAPSSSARIPDDDWALPPAVRATLPAKLKNAADRQLFSVDYSRGHARTLYVFADPACPNCQRFESALRAAAQTVNVVVFPVAVIGRDASLSAITPVLCLPSEKRLAAWQALFDVGHEALHLGKPKTPPEAAEDACDIAGKALGVNEVAYQTYRIPGTPWVIADDGRPVSQAVVRDPAGLRAFLAGGEDPHAAD